MSSGFVTAGSRKRFFPAKAVHREKKLWGEEQWIVNKEYCGKKLILRRNHRCSMHAHKRKDEVFYLQSGKVLLELDGDKHTLHPGDFVHVPAGSPHRFTGLADSEIIEFSTTHDEGDSYRTEHSGHIEEERFARQSALIGGFRRIPILVLGDVMLDTWLHGTVDRVSPEAPIPVVHHSSQWSTPGGAANAAMNAASLGSSVTLLGVTGTGPATAELQRLLRRSGVRAALLADRSRRTTEKMRVVAGNGQQIVRVDYEQIDPLSSVLESRLLAHLKRLLPRHKALLISDYAKGTLSQSTLRTAVRLARARRIPVVIDPKPVSADYLSCMRGATVITPNRREAQMLTSSRAAAPALARMLQRKTGATVVLTLGEEGMLLQEQRGAAVAFPAHTRDVADVSGAGDTAASVLTLALAAGATIADAVDLSNRAAGVVVGKQGTATLTPDELLRAL